MSSNIEQDKHIRDYLENFKRPEPTPILPVEGREREEAISEIDQILEEPRLTGDHFIRYIKTMIDLTGGEEFNDSENHTGEAVHRTQKIGSSEGYSINLSYIKKEDGELATIDIVPNENLIDRVSHGAQSEHFSYRRFSNDQETREEGPKLTVYNHLSDPHQSFPTKPSFKSPYELPSMQGEKVFLYTETLGQDALRFGFEQIYEQLVPEAATVAVNT